MTSPIQDSTPKTPQNASTQTTPVFEWPIWAWVYEIVIGVPMLIIGFSLALWLLLENLDTLTSGVLGDMFLLVSFCLAFFGGGVLFVFSLQRLRGKQSEALIFASSGHIMLLMPSVTLLFIQLTRDRELFLGLFSHTLDDRDLIYHLTLMVWVVVHTYFAVFLALLDNTSRFINLPESRS